MYRHFEIFIFKEKYRTFCKQHWNSWWRAQFIPNMYIFHSFCSLHSGHFCFLLLLLLVNEIIFFFVWAHAYPIHKYNIQFYALNEWNTTCSIRKIHTDMEADKMSWVTQTFCVRTLRRYVCENFPPSLSSLRLSVAGCIGCRRSVAIAIKLVLCKRCAVM